MKMSMFGLLCLCLALSLVKCEQSGSSESKGSNGFGAQSREYSASSSSSNFADSNPVFSSSSTTSYTRPSYTGYSSSYYPSEGYGYNSNKEVGLFGGDLISSGISILVGLFAFSMLIQIVTKVLALPIFENVLEARSMSANELVEMANMAAKAIEKFERLNDMAN